MNEFSGLRASFASMLGKTGGHVTALTSFRSWKAMRTAHGSQMPMAPEVVVHLLVMGYTVGPYHLGNARTIPVGHSERWESHRREGDDPDDSCWETHAHGIVG